jgi:hypothetical protein
MPGLSNNSLLFSSIFSFLLESNYKSLHFVKDNEWIGTGITPFQDNQGRQSLPANPAAWQPRQQVVQDLAVQFS